MSRECWVRGRLNESGEWALIAPTVQQKTSGWGIFKVQFASPDRTLSKIDAVVIAKEAMSTGLYQDVRVIEYGGADCEGNAYCHRCVWENGRWTEFTVRSGTYE